MLTLIFLILMIAVFGKLILLAFKAAWGITKILWHFILLPLVLIGLFFAGLVYIAIPLLVIIGIAALFIL